MAYEEPFFNASIKRLEQLMLNLDDLSLYAVNDNILGMYANLREIKKKSRGFLQKQDRETLKNKWSKIKENKINIIDGQLEDNPELLELLHDLDEWLQYTLHKAGVLYKATEVKRGLDHIRKRYKLENGNTGEHK